MKLFKIIEFPYDYYDNEIGNLESSAVAAIFFFFFSSSITVPTLDEIRSDSSTKN